MPEFGAVERVRDAMNVWMRQGIPKDFRQLYIDMKHIIGCLPPSVKTEEQMIHNNPNLAATFHPDGHVTMSCRACGWDVDSRIHDDWNVQGQNHATRCGATVTPVARDHGPVTIGCIVHYRSYGTPGGEYPAACRAAIITAEPVASVHEAVSLAVFNPDGIFLKDGIRHKEDTCTGGTWHWPCG